VTAAPGEGPGRSGPPAALPRRGWRGLAWSFACAWEGVVETAARQRNMRIHLALALAVAAAASAVPLRLASDLALLLCVFLVLSAEVANSALEALVDLVTRERHELARRAKDASAGAVLVLAAGSVAVLGAVVAHDWQALGQASLSALRPGWLAVVVLLGVVSGAAARRRSRPPAP
jgi:diacylglycerol kinase (ATP)